MNNHTSIFKLIIALSDVADVKLNLFYYGSLDNSKFDELISFASKASLDDMEYLKANTNELLLGLDYIEVLYNNYRLFIYFNGLNHWDISEVEYRKEGFFVKSHSHGNNEDEIMNEELYIYVPLELSFEVVKHNLKNSIALAKLLDIDGAKHMEDVYMKI